MKAYIVERLRLADRVAKLLDVPHLKHKLAHLAHHGEGWAHRVYLGLVSVEVKYWYGKAAVIILVMEVLIYLTREE